MIQEKYNRRIFDEGTEEAIQLYSHLRSNALSPVNIVPPDQILVINPDSVSLVEWIKEKAENTIVGMTNDYGTDMENVIRLIPEGIEKKLISEIKIFLLLKIWILYLMNVVN